MHRKCNIRNLLFSNKPYRFLILAFILIAYGYYGKSNSAIKQEEYVAEQGVITTLIRSDNLSISLTINMIHSVFKFHSFNTNHSRPFIIFHDHNFTTWMRERILSCVLKSHPHARISFALVDFQTSVRPSETSRASKSMGYRLMCRFWTYDIFYHPAIFQQGYDYLMRMDDDSYFSDQVSEDLFLYMDKTKLDYIYRATYTELTPSMRPILDRYVHEKRRDNKCIYNNFFVMRLKWFYESKRVQSFIHELVTDNLILREYIGDGCVHAAMLKIDDQVKSARVTDFPYGHNGHLMTANRLGWVFYAIKDWHRTMQNSCEYLTILQGPKGHLTQINLLK